VDGAVVPSGRKFSSNLLVLVLAILEQKTTLFPVCNQHRYWNKVCSLQWRLNSVSKSFII